ncbi:hypothetical protein E2C01_002587 [Portunus trituberculatus]|uniref:Uncharacterized protein n=1 Tax=Portunus trituberculatus TaxID=210409 RepID=A0A5B7CNN0_PORTR|nr:hypothetical protein [Portunus trituberculatus]
MPVLHPLGSSNHHFLLPYGSPQSQHLLPSHSSPKAMLTTPHHHLYHLSPGSSPLQTPLTHHSPEVLRREAAPGRIISSQVRVRNRGEKSTWVREGCLLSPHTAARCSLNPRAKMSPEFTLGVYLSFRFCVSVRDRDGSGGKEEEGGKTCVCSRRGTRPGRPS